MNRVIVISGYFNPMHTGHLDYIEGAAKLGDELVVIINSDEQVTLKGSTPFMNEDDRARLVTALECVSYCVIAKDKDGTVVETLKELYGHYALDYFFDGMTFANGGDRTATNSPEEEYCQRRMIATVYNVGGEKTQSSSGLIDKATTNN